MESCSCNFASSSSLLLPPKLPQRKPPPFELNLSKWKPKGRCRRHRPGIRSACGGSEDSASVNGFPITPNKFFMQEAIGAEYGEGFETFRADGPLKMDVDFLNDRLQEGFLQRIRYAMKPDEAYGLIFSWDNVVVDTQSLKLKALKQLAIEEGKELPEDIRLQKLMLHAGADHLLHKLTEPMEGLKEWMDAVHTARVPCAVVSSLDRKTMIEALDHLKLTKYFQAVVSEEDGMESIAHRFLSAALKLDRKPSKCIVFEDDPRGVTAAHNCTMMAIALIGSHPAYDLEQADLTVASFNELSVINLRRLFANKGSTFMDLQKQIAEREHPKRKLTVEDPIF
ncbi:5-amino-6-(5-phospho-D-ribitylamino)uracil phosphatase, chloroplastic isoform X2 [Eucalyptus grandis]|nr:5-amino-6-(5-phospho-D-ribitylamino)uracil phosphatase, chloroplastic isoform X2 [Eucalyptus grandis]